MKLKNSWNKPALGISIYPEQATKVELENYLKLAAKHNFKRVFTNLIGLSKKDLDQFVEISKFGKELGLEIIADIDKTVCELMGHEVHDSAYWYSLGVSGIRLDVKFPGERVAELSRNKEKLQVEINASDVSGLEQEIIKFDYVPEIFVASHNFFPQAYTALSMEKFERTSKNMKDCGFSVSAFVTLPKEGSIGAWKDNSGTPSLEVCRNMDILDQFQLLSASYYCDIVIVSTMYLTEEEMKRISNLNPEKVNFRIENVIATENEKNVLSFDDHMLRGDNPDDVMWRSTISRKKFSTLDIKPSNTKEQLEVGDVVVLNNKAGRYKGELHILKKSIPNDGTKNHIGNIPKNQLALLEITRPLQKFNFETGVKNVI